MLATDSGPRGRRFKSSRPDHFFAFAPNRSSRASFGHRAAVRRDSAQIFSPRRKSLNKSSENMRLDLALASAPQAWASARCFSCGIFLMAFPV